ncbi:MAG: methyltransferase [Rhodospirillales bacterium 20-64-7]|nr:MAG: methyltransferase [Rhodospirillales bacterium 20-64-7]
MIDAASDPIFAIHVLQYRPSRNDTAGQAGREGDLPSQIAGFFQGTGMPDAAWWQALWPDPAGTVAAAGIGPGMDVVDLCCGDGWFTLPIARIARHVTAIDIDADLLQAASRRLDAQGALNYDAVLGDAYEVARLIPQPCDFVLMANAFHGVPDQQRLASAIRSALAPGGRLAIVNWHARKREDTVVLGQPRGPKTESRMSPQQTIDAVSGSGLSVVQVVELPPYHYAAVFARTAD